MDKFSWVLEGMLRTLWYSYSYWPRLFSEQWTVDQGWLDVRENQEGGVGFTEVCLCSPPTSRPCSLGSQGATLCQWLVSIHSWHHLWMNETHMAHGQPVNTDGEPESVHLLSLWSSRRSRELRERAWFRYTPLLRNSSQGPQATVLSWVCLCLYYLLSKIYFEVLIHQFPKSFSISLKPISVTSY